jgi:hypothetical protein
MLKLFKNLVLSASLVICASAAWAQKATEIFIPIGQSPGLSGKHTMMGRIQSLNASDRSMTVIDAAGTTTTVRPDPRTQVWLDRSKLKLPNRKGDYADYRKDMTVEVKYRNNERAAGVVEWVKVQAVE